MTLNPEQKIEAFFDKLKKLEIADQEHLSNRGEFFDLKVESETPELRANKAAYNIVKAIKYAVQEGNIKIFSPAPLTLSKNVISAHIESMDPEVIGVLLPVLEEIPALIPPLLTGWAEQFGFKALGSQFNALVTALAAKLPQPSSEQPVDAATAVATEVKTPEQYIQKSSFTHEEYEDCHKMLSEIEQALFGKAEFIENMKNELEHMLDLESIEKFFDESLPNFLNVNELRQLDHKVVQALKDKKIIKEREELQREWEELDKFEIELFSPDFPLIQFNPKIAARLKLDEEEQKQWQALSEQKSFLSSAVKLAADFVHYMTDWGGEDEALKKENFKKDVLLKKVRIANQEAKARINDCLHSKLEEMDTRLKDVVEATKELGDGMVKLTHDAEEKRKTLVAAQETSKHAVEEELVKSLVGLLNNYASKLKAAKSKRVIINPEGTVARVLSALYEKLPSFVKNRETTAIKVERAIGLLQEKADISGAVKLVHSTFGFRFFFDTAAQKIKQESKRLHKVVHCRLNSM